MVSLKTLQSQVAKKKQEIAKKRKRDEVELQKAELTRELKMLNRTASTKRNIVLAQRTGRGFKRLATIAKDKASRQIKRIKEQRDRDDAIAAKRLKKGPEVITVTKIITGKGKKRKVKVTRSKSKSKKTKSRPAQPSSIGDSVFGNLDF